MQNLEDMCKEYTQIIYKYLFCITRDREIAEDLSQETLYKAIKHIKDFRGDCKINLWLCKIARNEWFMYLNKNKKIRHVAIDEASMIADKINIEDEVIGSEIRDTIYQKIKELDEETSQIMLLHLEQDMNFKEIGDIFNRNETWARVKFFRGKQKVKERLKDEKSETV